MIDLVLLQLIQKIPNDLVDQIVNSLFKNTKPGFGATVDAPYRRQRTGVRANL